MVLVVHDTSNEEVEPVQARQLVGQEDDEELCIYVPPAPRETGTDFEMFQWVSAQHPNRAEWCMRASQLSDCCWCWAAYRILARDINCAEGEQLRGRGARWRRSASESGRENAGACV